MGEAGAAIVKAAAESGRNLRDVALDEGVDAELYDHVTTGLDDELELNPLKRIGWRRRTKGALPKVAVRAIPGLDDYSLLGKAWFHTKEEKRGKPVYDIWNFLAKDETEAAWNYRCKRINCRPRKNRIGSVVCPVVHQCKNPNSDGSAHVTKLGTRLNELR